MLISVFPFSIASMARHFWRRQLILHMKTLRSETREQQQQRTQYVCIKSPVYVTLLPFLLWENLSSSTQFLSIQPEGLSLKAFDQTACCSQPEWVVEGNLQCVTTSAWHDITCPRILVLAAEDSRAQLHSGLDFILLLLESLVTLACGQLQMIKHRHISSNVCFNSKAVHIWAKYTLAYWCYFFHLTK